MNNAKKKPKTRKKPIGGTGVVGLSLKQLAQLAESLGLHVLIETSRGRAFWTLARKDTGLHAGTYAPHLKRFTTAAVPYTHFDDVDWMNALERIAKGRA